MNLPRIGAFKSFNARFLRPEEVGATFVNSPFLDDILEPSNTAILGPRGSGKTTLLKMLTLPAMLRWKDPARDAIADALQYLAVYIPSSLTWNADYRGFSGQRLTQEAADLISVSLFRHSVLFSLLNTWQEASQTKIRDNSSLARFFLPMESKDEAQHVKTLARQWDLPVPISSMGGLREAIFSRIRILQTLTVRASYIGKSINSLLNEFPFLASHFLDDCTSFGEFLDVAYGFKRKIALCFDEVEIAPIRLRAQFSKCLAQSINDFWSSFRQRHMLEFLHR